MAGRDRAPNGAGGGPECVVCACIAKPWGLAGWHLKKSFENQHRSLLNAFYLLLHLWF